MTTHRFFLPPESFANSQVNIHDKELIKQLSLVLRAQKGDKVILLDNSGMEYLCEMELFSKKDLQAKILEKSLNNNEENREIVLYQAITKRLEPFELILQKCTELGVTSFVPVVSDYCQRDFLPKVDRLERIIKEAAEQSERGKLPELREIMKFDQAVQEVGDREENVFFYERVLEDKGKSTKEKVQKIKNEVQSTKVNVFIGPEGGFSEREVELVKSLGDKFQIKSLGKRILRAETAAIVGVALISSIMT